MELGPICLCGIGGTWIHFTTAMGTPLSKSFVKMTHFDGSYVKIRAAIQVF